MQDLAYFSTKSEKEFIDGLGTFGTNVCLANKLTRQQLLENYLLAAWQRVNWGDIDGNECVKYARKSLNLLIKGELKNA